MFISFITQNLGYDLSKEEPSNKKPFKDSLPFTTQLLIRMQMIEPNGQWGYRFIEEEGKA